VHLFAAVNKRHSTANRILTLTAGFRPGYNVDVAVAFPSHTVGVLQISPDGTVNTLGSATARALPGARWNPGRGVATKRPI
jgi:hypothetical protein